MKPVKRIFISILFLLFASTAFAQGINYQYDLRGFSLYSMDAEVELFGFSYSGYADFYGIEESKGDPGVYFTRHNLAKWFAIDDRLSVGGVAEYDDLSGPGNDYLRIAPAVKYAFTFGLNLGTAYFPYETDGGGQKLAIVADFKIADYLMLSGYADRYNENLWRMAAQADLQIYRNVSLLAKFNLNELFDGEHAALGLAEMSGFSFGVAIK